MLKTAREKAKQVVEKFRKMKLALAARKIVDRIEKTLTYINSPTQHWTRIETIIPLRDLIEKSRAELKQSALFRWTMCINTCMCQTSSRSWNPIGSKTLYEYEEP